MHIQSDLLSIRVEIEASTHAAAESHSEDFTPRGTEVALPRDGGFWHDSLSRAGGVEVHVDHVLPALGVHRADTLPLRKPMKFTPEIEAPGSEDGDDGDNEHATKGKNDSALRQATKASEARLGPSCEDIAAHRRRSHIANCPEESRSDLVHIKLPERLSA